jgi:hypothetical protein
MKRVILLLIMLANTVPGLFAQSEFKTTSMNQFIKLGRLFLLFITLASCNRSNGNNQSTLSDSFLAKLQSITLTVSEEQSFPEWLSNKISEIEALHAKDVDIVKVRIYYGEWNGQHYYLNLNKENLLVEFLQNRNEIY